MATVHVSIGKVGPLGQQLVFYGRVRKETITSSGTNAAGALPANEGDVAKINCATAVIVQSGSAASATAGQYIDAGETGYIGMVAGDTINVIDA